MTLRRRSEATLPCHTLLLLLVLPERRDAPWCCLSVAMPSVQPGKPMKVSDELDAHRSDDDEVCTVRRV